LRKIASAFVGTSMSDGLPWEYGGMPTGIIDKWLTKYDMENDVCKSSDYIESINQIHAGQFLNACAMTSNGMH